MESEREAQIRQRAYTIWESEGRPEGRDVENWRRAEKELEAEPEAPQDATPAAAPEPKRSRKFPIPA